MSNKLSGTLTLRLPSGDNRFKAFFNVGESGFATEEYVKQQIAELENKEEGKYVEKTDIQDTLNSDNSNKPLSANQGKVLKGLLDAKVIEAGAVPMDSEPTEGNINNVVSSDGLAKEFNKSNTEIVLGGVYDVSAHNGGVIFESLQVLLSSPDLSTLIPTSVRHGGMTIRFIQGSEQSSENKYVQYRFLLSSSFITSQFTNSNNWQGVNKIPTAGSIDLVESGGTKNFVYDQIIERQSNEMLNLVEINDFKLKEIAYDGSLRNSNKSVVNQHGKAVLANSYFYVDEGFMYRYALYNNSGTTVSISDWKVGSEKTIINEDYTIRIEISTINRDTLEDTSVSSHLHYYLLSKDSISKDEKKIQGITLVSEVTDFVFAHIGDEGNIFSNGNRNIVNNEKVKAAKGSYFYVDDGYKYQIGLYDYNTGEFIRRITWVYGTEVTVLDNNYQIRVEISNDYESSISDFSILEHLHCFIKTLYYNKVFVETDSKFSAVNQKLNELELPALISKLTGFVFKHIDYDGTLTDNSNKNIVNANPVKVAKGSYVYVDAGYKYQYALYNYNTGEFIRRVTWVEGITTFKDNYQVRIEISKSEEPVLEDLTILEHLHYNFVTPYYNDVFAETDRKITDIENESIFFSLQANNIINAIGVSSFTQKVMTIAPPDKYSCWPRIGKVGNRLVCMFVKVLVHEDPHTGKGALYTSISENGIIWTPKRLSIDTEHLRDGVTGCGNDADGNLLFFDRVGYPSNANTYYDVYRTSNGVSFEKISNIPASSSLGHCGDIINVPTKGLMAFFGTYGNYSDSRSWGYILSEDNGETWNKVTIEDSLLSSECPMEISAAYLGDGKILAVGRYEGNDNEYMWQMQSSDYGVTWNRVATNVAGSYNTPSMIYNSISSKVSLYIYNRSTGKLEYREAELNNIWDNPTNWPNAEIIASGAASQDAGNVTTCQYGQLQIAAYYTGTSSETGIYCILQD